MRARVQPEAKARQRSREHRIVPLRHVASAGTDVRIGPPECGGTDDGPVTFAPRRSTVDVRVRVAREWRPACRTAPFADRRMSEPANAELLRYVNPSGDPGTIVSTALKTLLRDAERRRCADVRRPRSNGLHVSHTRHVPAAVKRAVWTRDKGQCGFVGTEGRCRERAFLELHHLLPFAAGGPATVDNLQLRCRAHNVYEAEPQASASTS
jgi:hypothetical protein